MAKNRQRIDFEQEKLVKIVAVFQFLIDVSSRNSTCQSRLASLVPQPSELSIAWRAMIGSKSNLRSRANERSVVERTKTHQSSNT
jgi:hypothetical protein